MRPEDILPTYDTVAHDWHRTRNTALFERRWLDRMIAAAPGPRVLDLGCGSGRPIADDLVSRGLRVTGVDGAAAMIEILAECTPGVEAVHADMRTLALGRRFDAILAWNSFFHLSPADQRAMFPIFSDHAAPGAALLFTSGPEQSERIGRVAGHPVYHASLSPAEYRAHLGACGFDVLDFRPEDPDCGGHSVWLARRQP
ncbi:class I SAM-dependent methyltransferase [Tranquillimonas alkanivorans]|uniref:Methyltransferase domain-containing protein n=1 Tax=Tranquillimonas alkanivorans TaxID=441119 RepID=A0A1I5RPP7_9RHOB|nr:class I SAM-dependent methyltransferase [Tranquillimonas alkanivorans]SFP60473.1 Methyltransferase domain-containing protein [Tranquillimonas alkanivorans]